MKVLQISPVAPPYHAGIAVTAGEIYKATKEAGVSADLVSVFGDSTIPGLKHWRFPGLGLLAATPSLPQLIKNFDLVHLHYPCFGNAMMVALGLGKKPLVVSYHMDTVGRGLRRPVFWFHSKFIAPRFLGRAAKIVVASRDYAEHSLLGRYPELMAKVTEVPFGVDAERFKPKENNLPLFVSPRLIRLGWTKEGVGGVRKNVLFVGGLDEQHYFKGLDVLLEAITKLPGVRLTVVGSGNLVKHYARRAYELGIDERVIFAGKVSDEELPNYYRSADVFCLPSLDRSEAFGMVVLEAAACGVPAVVSDIPGVRTAIKSGETGLLVPPGDASALAASLGKIISDHALREKMSFAARTFALTRGWKAAGEKYKTIYENSLSGK